ncbi:hypothetical protein GCM10027566_23540 [Arachidicoccus ginsenosidivorans]
MVPIINLIPLKIYIMEYQSFKVWKINPSKEELDEEINVYKNIHGEVINRCILKVEDNTAILIGDDGLIKGVFSLNHFYIKNWMGN